MRHSRLIVIVLVCFLLPAGSAFAQESNAPTAAEAREAKVYEAIAEMIVRRDDLLRKFAVVMHGEAVTVGLDRGRDPIVRPMVNVRIVDRARSFDLRAGYSVITNEGTHFETGSLSVQIATTHQAVSHNPLTEPTQTKPPGTKLSEWRRDHPIVGGADPYDDYLFSASSFFSSTHGAIEEAVLGRYKLLSTESGLGGKLISYWSWNANSFTKWRVTMEFDPAYEMMPVRVKVRNLEIKNDFHDIRITWRKHGETILPYRIELAYGDVSRKNRSTECTFRCYWMVGDEVPDDVFESEDHLGTLLDHVGVGHSRKIGGQVIPHVHELPKDLFTDTKDATK